jgi:steroid delta-isomerase-like uncharacterized protein
MAVSEDLRAKREALVIEHMESENRHEFDVTMQTFHHPRYEIVPTGDVYDGAEEVQGYWDETRAAFPAQRNKLIGLYHSDDAVVVEFDLLGTHNGTFRGIPPTGKAFEVRCVAVFVFDGETDKLVCERAYFDSATILRQLGLAHDPLKLSGRVATLLNHPVTIGGAFVRSVLRR